MESLTILVTEKQKAWVTKNGNASHCIRELIEEKMEDE